MTEQRVLDSFPGPRHAAQAQPSHRERFLEAVLESAIDYAILSVGMEGCITGWNEGARNIMGWTEAEILGQPVGTIFLPEDRAAGIPQREMHQAATRGRGSDERWHCRKDGTSFWANGEMMPLHDADGQQIGFLKILRDRTAQRLALEKQQEDADFLRDVLAASADCVKVLDGAGRILFANPACLAAWSKSDAAGFGGVPWPGLLATGQDQAAAAVAAAFAGQTAECRNWITCSDGRDQCWDSRLTPLAARSGEPPRVLCVSRDVTAAVGAGHRVAESEERLRLALDGAQLGLWDFDVPSGTLTWDTRCRALFGITDDRPVAWADFLAGLHPDDRDRVDAAAAAALDPAGDGRYEIEYRTIGSADGQERWVAAHGQARFEAGRPVRFTGIVSDIGARIASRTEATLLAEELQHRVKNTLAITQAIVRQTLRSNPAPEIAMAAIDERLAAMGRAHSMLTTGNWAASELGLVVKAALDLHDDRSGRLVIDGPRLLLSPQSTMPIALLLHELFTNAAKYGALSNDTGTVLIRWSAAPVPGHAPGDSPDDSSDMRAFHLHWQETGGPVVTEPARRGFGSRLIERSLGRALSGEAVLRFPPEGVSCTVTGLIPFLGD